MCGMKHDIVIKYIYIIPYHHGNTHKNNVISIIVSFTKTPLGM